jgi:hypothetical protein
MGKTMAKSTIIWGEQHSVSLARFSSAHMAQIIDLIHKNIGPTQTIDHAAAQSAIRKAKGNPKMKNGYVKVGLIDGNLVLRCKEKKFLGDIEVDAVLAKSYRAKVAAWDSQKMEAELDELQRQAEEREKQAKARRLKHVMNTPDAQGDSLRTKNPRAADKAHKLGVGDYAKHEVAQPGLTPRPEDYQGQVLDHQKNRYGRFLPDLKKVWDQHGGAARSFSKWLEDVEANKTNVPGVNEARALTHPELGGGKIVQGGGVTGGRVVYLNDDTRQAYVARVTKGAISGANVGGSGEYIFVIGPDNKIYAGSKARAAAGQPGAFNHSSFFSGGPVRSAGTMRVNGGRITRISNQSGHYSPTKEMVVQAVRKFSGGDADWLGSVTVALGAKTMTGAELLGADNEARPAETWGKYSVGAMSREQAARVLAAASDGAWLVRVGSNKKLVISYRKGHEVEQDLLTKIGEKGLDRKKLLLPGTLATPVSSTPPAQSRVRNGNGPQNRPTTRQRSAPTPPSTPARGRRPAAPATALSASLVEGMRHSEGWHGDLNRAGSEALLKVQPYAWLLREGRDGIIAFSYNDNGTIRHVLVSHFRSYSSMVRFTARHPDTLVKA